MTVTLSFFDTFDNRVFEIKLKRSEFDNFLGYFTSAEIYNGNLDLDADDHDGDKLITTCDDLDLVRRSLFTLFDTGFVKSKDMPNSAWNVEYLHLEQSSVTSRTDF